MTMMLEIDRPIPSQLVPGMLAVDECADGVLGDVGGEHEECDRDEQLGALLGVLGESASAGEAPDDDDRGEPSIAESRPKPSSATELARIAAVIAIAPSALM